jgi:RHS repeat-associated protein
MCTPVATRQDSLPPSWKTDSLRFVILLAEHDKPSLAAKKKQQHVALKTATSTPKNRVWNFFGSPLGQIRSESDLSAETATGSVQFSYETASGQAYYYTWDHLGSTREMCSSTGAIVARYSYDPYGVTTLVQGSNLATFQYTGDYYHATSGLYLTPHRAFDPNTGKWLSRDPISEDGGINLYGFCSNDPADNTDTSGLATTCAPPEPTVTPVDPVPPGPVPPDFPPGFVVPALVIIDLQLLISDGSQISQIINSERELEQMEAAIAAQDALNNQLANCPKPCRGLLRQLLAHMKKLQDYMNNPDAFDNKDLLKNAKTPEERQEIIQGRINNLRKQITNFAKQLKECLEKNSPVP